MTRHTVIAADGRTHAKIGFLAFALSAVFLALISASSIAKSDTGARTAGVVKASAITKIATSERSVIR